jgi:hypothetical protein
MSLNFSFLETHFGCDDFVVFLLRISMVFAFVGVYEVFWLIFSNEDLLILYFIVWIFYRLEVWTIFIIATRLSFIVIWSLQIS